MKAFDGRGEWAWAVKGNLQGGTSNGGKWNERAWYKGEVIETVDVWNVEIMKE